MRRLLTLAIMLVLGGCTTLLLYPKTVEADGYLVECGKPYTDAEDKAGVDHDCEYKGKPK